MTRSHSAVIRMRDSTVLSTLLLFLILGDAAIAVPLHRSGYERRKHRWPQDDRQRRKLTDLLPDVDLDLGGVVEETVKGVINKTREVLSGDSVISKHAFVTYVKEGLIEKPVKKLMTVTGYLTKFGYLSELPEGVTKHDIHEMTKAIKEFQRMYHLKPSGILDIPTMQAMTMSRCGMPDIRQDTLGKVGLNVSRRGHLREKKYYVPGYVWPKKQLTWFFQDYMSSADISPSAQRAAFSRAFQVWQAVSSLRFTEASSKADINIRFAHYDHGDGQYNTFDGLGGVLAHAFFPTSGEAHFDDMEDWSDRSEGTDITTVAAHEFGHALGLGHSDVQGALMAPYYQGYDPNFKLHSDDISAIQSLYGPPGAEEVPIVVTQQPTTTTVKIQPSSVQPDTCTVVYRAVTQTHDYRVYIYSGEWMWRVSDYGLDDGFPMMINAMYENAPRDIQAALFTSTNSYTHFFKGNVIWRYYGFYLENQKTVTTSGYPTSITAAIKANSGQIYLLQGSSCWKFDEVKLDVVSPTPAQCSTVFPGSPTTFDSAVKLDQEPFIYYFSGLNYYKYSEVDKKVLAGYPKTKAGPWMGPACGAPPFTPK